MKFMLSWRIHEDKRMDALKVFSAMSAADDQADMGPNIKLIGRWHDIARFEGVAIFESDDPQAIAGWAMNWVAICDIEVSPVLDDEETRELGRKKLT